MERFATVVVAGVAAKDIQKRPPKGPDALEGFKFCIAFYPNHKDVDYARLSNIEHLLEASFKNVTKVCSITSLTFTRGNGCPILTNDSLNGR